MTRRFLTVAILPLLVFIVAYPIAPVHNAEAQAEEPDVVDTEENAAKLLARVLKGQMDGAAPAAEWPENIRKSGNAWIIDIDTQGLPSGAVEQIIIETTAAGGHTGNAKRQSRSQRPVGSGEPHITDSEKNAAKLLASAFKEKMDGSAPAADWPETIRKSGNAWIVEIDTQSLPGGYPEQIIIETIAAGGHTGIAKRPSGTQQSVNSPMVFKSARIRLFHLPSGVPENFASDAVTKAFVDPTDPIPMAILDLEIRQ